MSTINHNSLILFFSSNIVIYFVEKKPVKVQNFEIFKCSGQNSSCQFWTDKSISLQILHHSPLSWHKFPCKFSARTFSNLDKRTPSKSQFLDFWACSRENLLNSYVIFESTSRFPFKFCINIQCHQTWLFCIFLAPTLYTLVKSIPLKCIFLRFSSAQIKICQIPHVNFEMEVNSVSNFESFFIAMTHNSRVSFKFINFQL